MLEGEVARELINRSKPSSQQHPRAQTIKPAVANSPSLSAVDEISNSWHRCMADYHVDPKNQAAPNVVTQTELNASKEPVADIIAQAREEIDRLYAIVRQQGYVVLLCNNTGVAIHHRGDESRADDFKRWGIWLGGVWSEQIEGTNGIGTCITEQRPLLVHCSQHYRSRHSKLTCAGAPIFDALGKLAGVLDVSAVATEGPDRPHQWALAATIASPRAVEERLFREHFRHAWIVAALPSDDTAPSLLLAVDEDQRLVGADRVARSAFTLDDQTLAAGMPLSSLFDYSLSLFRRRGGQDIPVLLARPGRNDHWRALITPPLAKSSLSRNWPEAVVHAQPRLSMLSFMPVPEAPDLNRGGLSPNHVARAFQQSVGVPPHRYLLRRRLEHVGQMLRDTQLPLSHIALAVGFSDQSHLNRHFRRLTGMSPSLARGLER